MPVNNEFIKCLYWRIQIVLITFKKITKVVTVKLTVSNNFKNLEKFKKIKASINNRHYGNK